MISSELEILRTAIINETEGQHFYKLAASQIEDSETKQALEFLAQEEQVHYNWLVNMYQKSPDASKFDAADLSHTASPGVFNVERVKPESGSLEVSVFKIGVLMEKASIDFYKKAAAEAESDELKKLCLHLANWEGHHLETLEKIYDSLKAEWWDKQGFSPA